MRIARLHREYEIELKYTLFPLHPYVPAEGMSLEELFGGRNFDLEAIQQHLKHLAQAEGLDYGERTKTYNSRLAQELAKWAESQPNGSQIHDRLYQAYFTNDTNLADIDSLVTIATSLNLDGGQARSVLENRDFKEKVDADWNRCRELSIKAVPTYFCHRSNLVGAQTYDALLSLIESQGATARH